MSNVIYATLPKYECEYGVKVLFNEAAFMQLGI